MASRKKRKKISNRTRKGALWSSLAVLIVAFFAWSLETYGIPGQEILPEILLFPGETEGTLRVWYADIGQADCQLIQTPEGKNILIDAGEAATGEALVQWLKDRGVEELEVVIATHPHADHIGGMADVIRSFPITAVLHAEGRGRTGSHHQGLYIHAGSSFGKRSEGNRNHCRDDTV